MILTGMDLFMDLIGKSSYIVAIIGAGISTNAGIPDFRGPNGLYSRKDIPADKLFDFEYFKTDPSLFYTHIWEGLLGPLQNALPTKGHKFLKRLEDLGKLKMTVSQNIDGLHRKAGVKNIIDVHGNFDIFYCTSCYTEYVGDEALLKVVREFPQRQEVPKCPSCGGVLKPSVVFFGEPVQEFEKALTEVQKADLLVCIGSSLVVYPVASLPSYISDQTKLVIINNAETPYDERAKVVLHEDIDAVAEKLKLY